MQNKTLIDMLEKIEQQLKRIDECESIGMWECVAYILFDIQGYTAEKLSKLSEFLDGEGAFALLIELRENPERAIKKIVGGFHMK